MKALDICCGKGGWAKGLVRAGYDVTCIDIDQQFRSDIEALGGKFLELDARNLEWWNPLEHYSLIVCSPPCQEFSRHDMPWLKRKNPPHPVMTIQIWRAAEDFAKRMGAPLVIENVRGAQQFMGQAKARVGRAYLWGDVPTTPAPALRVVGTKVRDLGPGEVRGKETRPHDPAARSELPYQIGEWVGNFYRRVDL